MKMQPWFDPITERWQDPKTPSAEPLTYADQQIIQRLEQEDKARVFSVPRIWEALQATAISSLMEAPAVEPPADPAPNAEVPNSCVVIIDEAIGGMD